MRASLSIRFLTWLVGVAVLIALVAGCVAPSVVPAPAPAPAGATLPAVTGPSEPAGTQPPVVKGPAPTVTGTAAAKAAAGPAVVGSTPAALEQAMPAGTRQSAEAIVIPTLPAAAGSLELEGQWEGPLKVAGQEWDMIAHFKGGGSDLKGTMDIPAQAVKNIALAKISQQGSKVHFEAFSGARLAVFDGEIKPDGTLAGDFQQAGYKGTFTLLRAAATARPTEVLPYRQEEVTYKNGDVTLAGTLTLPQAGGPFPALVLITGSGLQNRDGEIPGIGFQPFRLIADYLTRNGLAVLRVDDRGVGGSTGDVSKATSEDFAGDVLAGVNFLKARPDINPKQIGLLGHSEGGVIAPMVAVKSPDVSYVILLSGLGVNGEQVLMRQLEDIMKADGASQAEIDKAAAEQKQTIEAVKTGKGWDELKAEWAKILRPQVEALPAEQLKAMGGVDKAVADAVQAQVDGVNNPWFKFFMTYDPASTLARVKVPVLAIFGGKDLQVATEPNEAGMRKALAQGGNNKLTVKEFPDANHLYQTAATGSPSEYASLPKEFVRGLLEYITNWIKGTLK